MATDEDIKLAFDETWKARQHLAHAEHELHLAEKLLELRRNEHQAALEAVTRADVRLQGLASRSAGVTDAPPSDDSDLKPRVGDGYRPIQRRHF